MMILGEEDLRDVSAAKHRAEEEVGRRRRTVPVLPSLVGLCVLGAAIIVWLTMPAAPGPVAQTAPQLAPTPAPAASTQAAPLSPMQEKALKPKDTFKECANCPEMVVVPAGSFTRDRRQASRDILPTKAHNIRSRLLDHLQSAGLR